MAGMERSVCLDDQRKEWIRKMQNQAGGSTAPKPIEKSQDQQPDSLTVDDETAKEIASHTLANMLKKLLVSRIFIFARDFSNYRFFQVQQAMINALEKGGAKFKTPSSMTPEELVEMRRDDPKAWDDYVTANSLAAFGKICILSYRKSFQKECLIFRIGQADGRRRGAREKDVGQKPEGRQETFAESSRAVRRSSRRGRLSHWPRLHRRRTVAVLSDFFAAIKVIWGINCDSGCTRMIF